MFLKFTFVKREKMQNIAFWRVFKFPPSAIYHNRKTIECWMKYRFRDIMGIMINRAFRTSVKGIILHRNYRISGKLWLK